MGEGIPIELRRKIFETAYSNHVQARTGAIRALIELGNAVPSTWLIEALHHEDWNIRKSIIQGMGEIKNPIFVQSLLVALKDQQPEVRQAAAQALRWMKEPSPIEPLYEALYDEDMRVCLEVALILKAFTLPFSTQPLIEALHHPESMIRLKALFLLLDLGETITTEQVRAALNNYEDVISEQTAYVLSHLEEDIPLHILHATWHCKKPFAESAVRAVLKNMPMHTRWQLFLMTSKDEDKYHSSSWMLVELEEELTDQMLEEALDTGPINVRTGIASILGRRVRNVPMKLLLKVMDDADSLVRARVAQGIAAAGVPIPTEILANALQNGGPRIRETVVHALDDLYRFGHRHKYIRGEREEESNVPTDLFLTALHDKEADIRRTAVWLIAIYAEKIPLPALITCLSTETNVSILISILRALQYKCPKEEVPLEPILDVLDRHQEQLYTSVIRTVGQFGPHAPVELLTAALGDFQQDTREAAAEALQKTHPEVLLALAPEAIAVIQKQGSSTIFTSPALSFFADTVMNMEYVSPALVEKLTQLLDWPYWQVRLKAIRAFGKLRRNIPDKAIQRLYELRHDPRSRAVREAADEVLAEILSLETGIEDN